MDNIDKIKFKDIDLDQCIEYWIDRLNINDGRLNLIRIPTSHLNLFYSLNSILESQYMRGCHLRKRVWWIFNYLKLIGKTQHRNLVQDPQWDTYPDDSDPDSYNTIDGDFNRHFYDVEDTNLLRQLTEEIFGTERCVKEGVLDIIRDWFKHKILPTWINEEVGKIAFSMYLEDNFEDIHILHDILLDYNCDNVCVLEHLKNNQNDHYKGCWAIDLLLLPYMNRNGMLKSCTCKTPSFIPIKGDYNNSQHIIDGVFSGEIPVKMTWGRYIEQGQEK